MPKSGHVTIAKIENVHIDTRRKIQIPKMLFFSIYDENNEVTTEKPFPNSGVTRRLWTLVVNFLVAIYYYHHFIFFTCNASIDHICNIIEYFTKIVII